MQLATVHFIPRQTCNDRQRQKMEKHVNVTFGKFKMGEEVVREVAEPPTYGIIKDQKITFGQS